MGKYKSENNIADRAKKQASLQATKKAQKLKDRQDNLNELRAKLDKIDHEIL